VRYIFLLFSPPPPPPPPPLHPFAPSALAASPPPPSCPLTLLPRLNFFLCSRTGREISGTSIVSQRERGAACARGIDANSRRAYSALPRRRAEKASRRSRGHRSVRRGALARCTVRSKFAFVALALFALRDAKLDKA